MWLHKDTAGSDAADHARELKRRSGDRTLTRGYGNYLTGVPLAMKSSLDPFLRRHQARLLGRKVDARSVADAKFCAVIRKSVDSKAHAHVVEKDVAGFQNCFMQAQYAVRFRSGLRIENIAMVLPPEERAVTGTERRETFLGNVVLEHCRRGHNLENGARSKLGLNGAVQERVERVIVETLPFVGRNPDGEVVWIRRGAADHGEDFPRARVESDDGTGPRTEGLLGDLLQIIVDG